ncbi:MAG TPA: hypothetical protein VFK94_01600, partial [Patescibacteria group bacterium]|nr:hypothetical protein [Patescibacteria group bacterium]
GNSVFVPNAQSGAVTVAAELLSQLGQAFDPVVEPPDQTVVAQLLSQVVDALSPALAAGSVTVQAGSLDNARAVYGPTIFEDQFVGVELILNNPNLPNPRIFVGVVPTNYQWNLQGGFKKTKPGGFPATQSGFKKVD